MKIRAARLILNPYEWLPADGESKVSFRSNGLDVIVDVEYEKAQANGNDTAGEVCRREIAFKLARYFFKFSFPGADPFEIEDPSIKVTMGALTELVGSELLRAATDAWRSISPHQPPPLRHFYAQFLSENVAFHVLAEDVSLSEEVPVNRAIRQ